MKNIDPNYCPHNIIGRIVRLHGKPCEVVQVIGAWHRSGGRRGEHGAIVSVYCPATENIIRHVYLSEKSASISLA